MLILSARFERLEFLDTRAKRDFRALCKTKTKIRCERGRGGDVRRGAPGVWPIRWVPVHEMIETTFNRVCSHRVTPLSKEATLETKQKPEYLVWCINNKMWNKINTHIKFLWKIDLTVVSTRWWTTVTFYIPRPGDIIDGPLERLSPPNSRELTGAFCSWNLWYDESLDLLVIIYIFSRDSFRLLQDETNTSLFNVKKKCQELVHLSCDQIAFHLRIAERGTLWV